MLPGYREQMDLDWTRAKTLVAVPTVLIVMLRAAVAVLVVTVSVTCTVKLLVPVAVGAPLITPLLTFKVRPAGRLPDAKDQV